MDYSAVTPGTTPTQTPQNQPNKVQVVPVVSKSDVVVKPASVGKKLYDSFFGASPKEVLDDVKVNVLKPSIKKILLDFIIYGASMMINGKNNTTPVWSPYSVTPFSNVINYNAITTKQQQSAVVSSPASSSYQPNGIFTLDTIEYLEYAKALEVMNSMIAYLKAYGYCSVSEYYDFSSVEHDFMTERWGWDNLSGIDIVAVGNRWRLKLPPVRPLRRA